MGCARITDMEGETYQPLLANNHPSLVMMQSSKNSAPVSFDPLSSIPVAYIFVSSVLTCPSPPLP